MTTMSLRNFYCDHCQQWLASVDVNRRRHTACRRPVRWREFVPDVFRGHSIDRDAVNSASTKTPAPRLQCAQR
jgi:hypothetical protein